MSSRFIAALLCAVSFVPQAFATTPSISESLPSEAFLGDQVCFDTNFTNSGDPGYSPYLRVILPDDLTLDSASFLGNGLTPTNVGVFPASPGNQLEDPLTETDVTGTQGSSFDLIVLPIGSVVDGGPALTTNICFTIESTATIGSPLTVSVQPVFQLGDSATGENGPIEGTVVTADITPTLVSYSYSSAATEGETVPGAAFVDTFTHTVDVANGQTLTSLAIQDVLDNQLQYVSSAVISGGVGCNLDTEPSNITPGGNLDVSCTSLVGTNSASDLSIAFNGYSGDVLDGASCSTLALTNNSTFDSQYNAAILPQVLGSAGVTVKHVATQQGVSSSNGSPGDTVTFTTTMQVSEFETVSNLVLTDTLDDGFDNIVHVSLNVSGVIAITPTVTDLGAAGVTVEYDITAVTGDLPGGTQITLTYSADIEQTFSDASPVLASDSLGNSSSISYDLVAGATACADTSSSAVSIEPVSFTKTLAAGPTVFAPGDTVTFRLSMDVPSGDTSDIVFEDFLPLPVFDAAAVSTTFGVDIVGVTGAGFITSTPTSITTDSATNKVTINWPDIVDGGGDQLAVDVSVVVVDTPFADNLVLSNLFQATTANSPGQTSSALNLIDFSVRAPLLVATLGVEATDNAGASIDPLPGIEPIDGDVTGVDAGDTINYVLTIENQGGAEANEVKAAIASLTGLGDAVITSVEDGDANTLSFTGTLAAGTFELDNALAINDGTVGSVFSDDTAIIKFTRVVESTAEPREELDSVATVNWTSQPGSTAFPDITDNSLTTIAGPSITLSIDSVTPQGSPGNVVVGDTVTYRAIIDLPEGQTPSLETTFVLPAGLAFVSSSEAVDTTGFVGTVDTAPTVVTSGAVSTGQTVTMTFDSPADTLVTNDNNASNNSFAVTFEATVNDDAANTALNATQDKVLDASLTYTGITGANIEDDNTSSFAEHDLQVTTTISPNASLDAGDTVTFTVEVENVGTAPAYDLLVATDLTNSGTNLFDTSSAAEGTTEAGFTYVLNGNSVEYTGASLAVGATATFTFTVDVQTAPVTGSTYDFSASASGDSQSGSVTGERTSSDNGDAVASTSNLAADSLQLISSSESWTADVDPIKAAIGEILTYSFTVIVPEGVTNENGTDTLVDIDLPVGTEFISGSGLLRGLFDNGLSGVNTGAIGLTDTAITPTVNGQILEFDIGNLTNSDADANDEEIVVTFSVLVLNTTDNNRGDTKTVQGNVNYNNNAGNPQTASASENFNVTLPNLSVTKTASPASVAGGTDVTFTVTATNVSAADVTRGWEWELTDVLPNQLEAPSVTSATLSRGNTDISACAGFVSNTLTVDSDCLSASERYIDSDEFITIVYIATVSESIGFEEQVTNAVDFEITTLPGDNGTGDVTPGAPDADTGERTGSGANNTSGDAVNDLVSMASDTITSGAPTVSLVSSAAKAPVSDSITLTATFAIPTGTTDNFVYTLDLPSGLTYNNDPVAITLPGADFSTSLSPSTTPGANTDPLVFDFGTVTNSAATGQNVTVSVDVTIDNVLANQDTTVLTANASLSYSGVTTPPTNDAEVEVIEANLDVVQTITAGMAGSDAGDTISYQTVITNTDTDGTAYRVNWQDIMPANLLGGPDGTGSGASFANINLSNPSNLAVLTGSATPLAVGDLSTSTTSTTDDTLAAALFDLPPTASVTITYDLVVSNDANAGDVLTNTTSASYNSLQDGTGRDGSEASSDDDNDADLNNYNESDSSMVTLANDIAIQSDLNVIHSDNDFAIGETVSIDLRVDVIEGEIGNVVVVNVLPDGLVFESSSIDANANISFSGSATPTESPTGTITFDLDSVTNTSDGDGTNDFFTLTIVARVDDVAGNIAGATLNNSASVSSDADSSGPVILDLDVVEPNLVATLTTDKTTVTLGDTVTLTVDVDHVSSGADAFDTGLELVIPAGLSFVEGSFMGQGTLDDADPTLLLVDLATIALVDGNKQFSIELTVDNEANIGDSLQVDLTNGIYSSLNGVSADEREYSFTASASVVSDDASFIAAQQTAILLIDVNGNGFADPGDTIEYVIDITNNGGTATGVTFSESIPTNTTYVPASASTDTGTISDSDGISGDIGTLSNGQTAQISFQVTVDAGTPSGYEIRAQGTVDSDLTIPEPTDADADDTNGDQANVTLVGEPTAAVDELYVQQTYQVKNDADADGAISPDDTLTIRYTISNTGTSDLTNVNVSELLPSGLTYVSGSAAISGGHSVTFNAGQVDGDIASLLTSETVVLTLDVTVDNPLFDSDATASSEQFILQASVSSDQTAVSQSDSNGISEDGNQPLNIAAISGVSGEPDLVVTQTWVLINDLDGDGIVDPGDSIELQTVVVNQGAATATGVNLNNPIPTNTSVVTNSGITSQGIISSEDPFAVNIGDVVAGQIVTTSVIVTVDVGIPASTDISSQATVSGDNFSDELSDNNGDSNDGVNPTIIDVSTDNQVFDTPVLTLISTSDGSTTGSQFIQGESLEVQLLVDVPAGRSEDVALRVTLPSGLDYQAGSATLTPIFDTALNSTLNPALINLAGSGIAVNVDSELVTTASQLDLDLGTVFNSDNDVNAEQYLLTFTLDSTAIPTANTNDFNVGAAVLFTDNLNQSQSQPATDLTLTLLNRMPVANGDAIVVDEDNAASIISVLSNDSDADVGQVLSITNVSVPNNGGSVTVNAGLTTVTYTPAADFNGTETFEYFVTDGAGGVNGAVVTVTVNPLPDAPVANDDVASTPEDTATVINVLINDTDADGDTLTVTSATASTGSVSIDADGNLVYTPPANFNGPVTITYTVDDGNGGTDTATVTLTVTAVNDDPVANDDVAVMNEDNSAVIDVLANDTDTEGDSLSVTGATATVGDVSINADGDLVVAPPENYNGPVTITYTISDGNGGTSTATVTVTVNSVNDAPVISDFSVDMNENTTAVIDVLAVASDADEDLLTISSATSAQGQVTVNPDGTISFTPDADFVGQILIEVCVTDGIAVPVCISITVNVNNVNTAPNLPDLILEVEEDSQLLLDLTGADSEDDPLTYTILTEPDGSLDGELPTPTFTPDENFNGETTFTYQANDGALDSNVATVTINVIPVNDAPVATDDMVMLEMSMQTQIDVLANDTDVDGDSLTIVGATTEAGTVTWTDSVLTFTPAQGYIGDLVIEYTVSDGETTDTASVFVTVGADDTDLFPVITVPDDIFIDANALFTKVDLGVASAVDRFGNPLPVSLVDGVTFYEPGTNTAYWSATDAEGRTSVASQLVRVRPLISLDKDQTVLEGRRASVGVNLNGTSPVYPLEIPYTVTGTAGGEDHDLVSGSIIIESGSDALIEFDVFSDVVEDDLETIVVELSDTLNRGNKFNHVITISEDNVAPDVDLFAEQAGERRVVVTREGGIVLIDAAIQHPDPDNQYTYVWENIEAVLTDVDADDETFSFDPSGLELGIYRIMLTITDADDTDFGDSETLYLDVVENLVVLTDADTDLDGIPDNVEGLTDTDRDGILDYLDPIPECNVLPEEALFVDGYLVEGDPGVCLRRGNFSIRALLGGAKVIDEDIAADDVLIPDPEAQNVGGIFDFIAYGLPIPGQSYRIVMPQIRPVPDMPVYRKFTRSAGWFNFVENASNRLWSTQGEPGYCPPPGGDIWTSGLTPGHWCVQVEMSDGGPNDADGVINSTIVDPGGVGVLSSNALPVAENDNTVAELNEAIMISPLDNDSDPDGDALVLTSANANFGTVTITDNLITYTPPTGYFGEDQIIYGVSDGNGGTDIGIIIVNVLGNLPPTAADDTAEVFADEFVQIDVLANDADPDDDTLTVTSAVSPNGIVNISQDGILTFTPEDGFVGTTTITYVVTDPNGAQSQGQVVVTVLKPIVLVRIDNSGGGGLGALWLMLLMLFSIHRISSSTGTNREK